MRSGSKLGTLAGLAAFAVGLVGYVGFGWRFGGDGSPVATGLAFVAVAIAVGLTVRNAL